MDQHTIDNRQATATEEKELIKNVYVVAPGVWRMKDVFVNVFILQDQESGNWVLVDTGLKSSAPKIKRMIEEVITGNTTPSAIIMTHGHFDHRGSLQQLAAEWNVPVYAHHMEMAYLNGTSAYPPADSSVGGGLMSSLSFAYPKDPINVQEYLRELPEDGSIPEMPEWRWIHTPGHTPGHISLFRDRDGVLVAGDAVVTTKQESAFSVLLQKKEICGPPKYFTTDWGAAAQSVKDLAELQPNVIASGHGHAMYGDQARRALTRLAKGFWHLGMPAHGRYVNEPAEFNDEGPTYVPPKPNNYMWLRILGATTMVVVGYILYKKQNKSLAKSLMAGSITMLTAPVPQL